MDNSNESPVSLKAIHNVQTAVRLEKECLVDDQCELEKLVDNMLKVPEASVRVVRENEELIAIYFQDAIIRAIFDKYPEVLLFDATI